MAQKKRAEKMKRKGMWFMTFSMTTLMLADFASTAIMGKPLLQALETNPLYNIMGSLIPLFLINCLVILAFIWLYKRSKPFWRYFLTSFFVWHSLVRVFAIQNNIHNYLSPPSPQVIEGITEGMKAAQYNTLLLAIFIPLILTLAIYIIFRLDHVIVRKEDVLEE